MYMNIYACVYICPFIARTAQIPFASSCRCTHRARSSTPSSGAGTPSDQHAVRSGSLWRGPWVKVHEAAHRLCKERCERLHVVLPVLEKLLRAGVLEDDAKRLGPVLLSVVDRPYRPLGLDTRAELDAAHELRRHGAVTLLDILVHLEGCTCVSRDDVVQQRPPCMLYRQRLATSRLQCATGHVTASDI